MVWCKEVQNERCWGLGPEGRSRGPQVEVITTATRTAAQRAGLSWERCLKVLEMLRPLAISLEPAWRED